MKKILLFYLFAILLLSNPSQFNVFASESYFARITQDNVYIYSTPQNLQDTSNQIFELPKTYFVEVLEKSNDNFYKVKYLDIIGYAKTTDLTFVKGTPVTPYNTKMTFRVFAPNGIALRSSPNTLNGVNGLVTNIPFLSSNIVYYGNTQGEEWVIYKGNVWYYCKYITESSCFYGYVYSAYCDLVIENDINNEILEETTAPTFSKNEIYIEESIDDLPNTTQILLICVACLPCIVIVYLLFKPSRTVTVKKQEPKKKIKKLKRSDYFEFDDEYFNS